MKLTHYIYLLGSAAAILTACNDDDLNPHYTVGEADNAIVLGAGIGEGGSGVQTRADGDVIYHKFVGATQLRLRVDGTWLSKGYDDDLVSKTTTATTAASPTIDSDQDTNSILDTHTVSFSGLEQLYWDDYGTADPNNMSPVTGNGRDKGLTIYGVAVDGKTTAPNVSDWESLSWNVGTVSESKISQKNGWSDFDLLTSNNVTAVSGADGTYKFADRASGKLLKFTHAMTKITVNLVAGKGFPGYETDAENAKFQTAPSVTLLGFNHTGTVKVESEKSEATSSTTNIEAWRDNGVAWTSGGQHTSQLTALVFPGNTFADATNILKIEADGNTYYVNATKINVANTEVYNTFERGKNYVFNITVDKTEIHVTATIKNWVDVEAEEVTPIINVNASYPGTGTGSNANFTSFSFYRSLNADKNYSKDYSGNANSYYAAEGAPTGTLGSTEAWTFTDKLYWPNHNTHYFFRGVWPLTSVTTDDVASKPHVKDNSSSVQVIEIQNVAYTQNSYPSDLAIGMPNFTDDNKMCDSHANHTPIDQSVNGICATTGTIALNFEYVMLQVEVELKSVTGSAAVKIDENTKVELVNVYKSGEVKLSDRGIIPTGSTDSYTLDVVSGSGNELKRHSAIVPQTLTYTTPGADSNVRFKITVTNGDNTTDIYYADVNPIKEKDKDTKVAPNGKWESGVHYKYVLTLSKTAIQVTATLKDWVTVTASEDVWF